jgi:hypothetical protein
VIGRPTRPGGSVNLLREKNNVESWAIESWVKRPQAFIKDSMVKCLELKHQKPGATQLEDIQRLTATILLLSLTICQAHFNYVLCATAQVVLHSLLLESQELFAFKIHLNFSTGLSMVGRKCSRKSILFVLDSLHLLSAAAARARCKYC